MAWRVADSLNQLLTQINEFAPHRSKVSDGSIGDPAHSARTSDHNPANGVVHARDFTHDIAGGFDAYKFAEALRFAKDERVKYVISNGRIYSGTGQGKTPWSWRAYTGSNRHNHHTHVSIKTNAAADSKAPWKFDMGAVPAPSTGPVVVAPTLPPLLKVGSKGTNVIDLQTLLNQRGAHLKLDGDFGPVTKDAVVLFQKANGLTADGTVGPYTWEKLKAPLPKGITLKAASKPVEQGTVNVDSLNLRIGAGSKNKLVASLPRGTLLTIRGRGTSGSTVWLLVAVDGTSPLKQGWVASPYVDIGGAVLGKSDGVAVEHVKFYMDNGFTLEQASGWVGNQQQEAFSYLDPSANGDNGHAWGIEQWRDDGPTPTRKGDLDAFAKSKGKPWNDRRTQLEFSLHEIATTEKRAGANIRAAKTVFDATFAAIGLERPHGYDKDIPGSGHGFARRLAYAEALYAKLKAQPKRLART